MKKCLLRSIHQWPCITEDGLGDHKYIVLGGKNYSVGRKECDILVTTDATVSRKHAEFSMTHVDSNLTNPAKLPVLLLKDLSKFGTWVNSQRVEGDRILNDGDTVYFGSPKSSFMIVYEPLVVTSSCLENPSKKSLRQLLRTLGGHMVSEWSKDCSLLIMSKISVTIKVICALVSLKPVVTPGYLQAYLKHLQGSSDKPDPELFIPAVAESQLDPSEVTFARDASRKTLFQGMTFVFLSQKQMKKMSLAIELAGGTPMLMEGRGELGRLTKAGTVVMACSEQEASQRDAAWITRVQTTLDRAGKHMIADAELGYAVLYASTEKHCNPDFDAAETSLSKLPSQTLSQADAFVPDSVPQHKSETVGHTQQKSPVKTEAPSPAVPRDSGRKPDTQTRRTRGASPGKTETLADTPTQVTQKPSEREKGQRSKAGRPSRSAAATPVTVKEEVISQPASQARKKRGRIIEDDDSEEETVNVNKRVKAEPVTPQGKPAPVTASDKKGDSPAAVIDLDPAWDSDDDDIDYSKIDLDESVSAAQRVTSPRRSPRHSPSRSEPGEKSKKRSRSKSRSRSPFASNSELVGKSKKKSRSRSGSPHETRKETLIKTETLSFVVAEEISDSSKDNVSEEVSSEQTKSVGSRSSRKGSGVSRSEVAEDDDTCDSSRKGKKRRVVESEEEAEQEAGGSGGGSGDGPAPGPAPEGFLRAVKSEQHVDGTALVGFLGAVKSEQRRSAGAPSVKSEPTEDDLPRGCGQVEMVSLVVKRPKPKDTGAGDCPDGFTRWKGKVIRNFKKFRKSTNCGADGLPNIIGGSDLEVHQGQRSKEMDNWMNESMQVESQHTSEDRRAQAMFEFNPKSKRRGR